MTVAMYAGRFDPVHNGHVDIVTRASELFDSVIVAVVQSSSGLFSTEERVRLFEQSVAHLDRVRVVSHSTLTVEAAQQHGATVLVRGLRGITDFTYELDMALMNRHMAGDIESVYLMTAAEYLFLSATRIRELASFGRDVSEFVPPHVNAALQEKFGARAGAGTSAGA